MQRPKRGARSSDRRWLCLSANRSRETWTNPSNWVLPVNARQLPSSSPISADIGEEDGNCLAFTGKTQLLGFVQVSRDLFADKQSHRRSEERAPLFGRCITIYDRAEYG